MSGDWFDARHLSTDARRAARLAGASTISEYRPYGDGFIVRTRAGVEFTVSRELVEETMEFHSDLAPARVRRPPVRR